MTSPKPTARRRGARRTLSALLAVLTLLSLAGTAGAAFEFEPGSVRAFAHDHAGNELTQAGAHPDSTIDFRFTVVDDVHGKPAPSGSLKDIRVELPRGFSGNPEATPKCTHRDFQLSQCPDVAMVGVEELTYFPFPGGSEYPMAVPVYNLVPPDGVVAQLGFQVTTVSVVLTMRVRSDGGYNLAADLSNLSQALQIVRSRMTLWGVPAEMNGPPANLSDPGAGSFASGQTYGGPSGAPRIPFLTNPSQCDGPVPVTTIRASSWQQPDQWATATSPASSAPTGCDRLAFAPSLDLRPDSPRAGAPAGYEVKLSVPQSDAPNALATPPLRDATVTLPQGVAISPSASYGLAGCTDAQAGLGSEADPACPAASKIGSATIETPVLPVPLEGSIFLGEPRNMDARTGEMIRIFVVASGQGVTIKLEGKITPDPVTGQLRAVFRDNPQLPFSLLTLRFQGGSRAPLTGAPTCGTNATDATFTSWSGQTATSTSSFTTTQNANGGPCAPLGFAPSFAAGTVNPAAGRSSVFTLTFGRDDTQQDLGDVTVAMPPGLTGLIASAVLCDNPAADAGACGAGSRIGSATVAVGPGATPFHLPGDVYVTEGYKGAQFGLAIVVQADAGPYRLGTVVVRAGIHVDRRDASLRVVADPMPTILQGIPLRIRTVNVAIDKPGFMLNPTSCRERRVDGIVRSAQGAVANVGSRFQVGGCNALPFGPRMRLVVGRRGRTREGITTPLSARLRMPAGQANNRAVSVTLPKVLNARLPVVNDACTREQFDTGRCTRQVGTASAATPLLRDPLRGPAYFVRNGRRLPDLMVALKGQGEAARVAIDLAGKVSIPRDLSLRTTFDGIPDVPITSFRLDLVAGRDGPIGTTANLCAAATRRRSVARIGLRAQSGRLARLRPRLSVAGCPKPAARRAGRSGKRGR